MRILGPILILLATAGLASAQWWNPLETPCEKAVRKRLASLCETAKAKADGSDIKEFCEGESGYEERRSETVLKCERGK